MMRRAIYPGSFDPLTNGHLDIIERSARLFDEVVVAILVNQSKQSLFSIDERLAIIAEVAGSDRVRVDTFHGLLVHYAVEQQATAIIRGIRAVSDYEYELQMALMNRRLEPSVETIFLMSNEAYSFVSSRLVKEVASLGGAVTGMVPPLVESLLAQRLRERADGKDTTNR
ncbi:MAG: pantetheine-phosphate adenylyltransferase [Blastocatellia bacterium]|jgi:pantetheine-phosphate adenylyltransferase|nr:pantetheine-phosphate adenylyltransferase [Blastocatellia bacterium]